MNGWCLIEDDLLLGLDGYAMQGQRELDAYLAKVAALDQWVATHPDR